MVKVTQILLLIGCAGTFVFLAACCGGNEWTKVSVTLFDFTYKTTTGLWMICDQSSCLSYGTDNLSDWFKAVRAFSLLAVLACAGGSIMAILSLVSDKVKGLFAGILLFGAAGCGVIALAIYADKMKVGDMNKVGWSYILGWLGVVGAIGSGIIGIISDR